MKDIVRIIIAYWRVHLRNVKSEELEIKQGSSSEELEMKQRR